MHEDRTPKVMGVVLQSAHVMPSTLFRPLEIMMIPVYQHNTKAAQELRQTQQHSKTTQHKVFFS